MIARNRDAELSAQLGENLRAYHLKCVELLWMNGIEYMARSNRLKPGPRLAASGVRKIVSLTLSKEALDKMRLVASVNGLTLSRAIELKILS